MMRPRASARPAEQVGVGGEVEAGARAGAEAGAGNLGLPREGAGAVGWRRETWRWNRVLRRSGARKIPLVPQLMSADADVGADVDVGADADVEADALTRVLVPLVEGARDN